ncbi:MAG: DUF4157 domain-containing protein [Chloroflexi bacterium]|nr:DUF4157 domain-containing protein [Chloroflexota bacterium]
MTKSNYDSRNHDRKLGVPPRRSKREATSATVRNLVSDAAGLFYLQRTVGNKVVNTLLAQPVAQPIQDMEEEGEEEEEEEGTAPQESVAATVGSEGGPVSPEVAGRIQESRGGGTSLDPAIRTTIEGAFGTSFDDVRVHTDQESDVLNRRMNATAFTTGSDIFFSQGAYQPGTILGQRLLAHELTHVLQQRGGSGGGPLVVGPANDSYEQEAERVATQISTATQQPANGLPGYLLSVMTGAQSNFTQYQTVLQNFQQEYPDPMLETYRSKLSEPNSRVQVNQASPLQQIRRFTRATAPAIPDVATVMADGTVKAAIEKAWTDSKPNAPDVPMGDPGSQKKEQGGWIIWNSDTKSYRVVRVGAGTRDGLGPIAGTRPNVSAPEFLVAWFHTHPNKTSEGYANEPSDADVNWQNAEAKVPGIVRAHDGYHTIPYP